MEQTSKTIAVVGGGLVGSLEAILLAKKGHTVHLYELRSDLRKQPRFSGVSINLALSVRGIAALRKAGLDDLIVRQGIPMHGRMIHNRDGSLNFLRYGRKGQYILSIDRRNLNERLLDAAEKNPKVTIFFEHKLKSVDIKTGRMVFTVPNQGDVETKADYVFGCDGNYSSVRRAIMRNTRMDYRQEYIPHGYKELTLPPTADKQFQLADGSLHIWPRGTFMMIGLPNLDKTFTLTMFMPFATFDAIKTEEDLLSFFEREFPDSIPLIGKEKLVEDYFRNPTGSLRTIKCKPYHCHKAIILGDAAHAMVPFYGQGMNAGLEDANIFDELLTKNNGNFEATFEEFSRTRNPNAEAICDLALSNYVEMRDSVNSTWFRFRKVVDNTLNYFFPNSFIPLYTMVTFSEIPYAEVIARDKRQKKLVSSGLVASGFGLALAGFLGGYYVAKSKL
eukprot:m.145869 g.145869  ORF g.145869 m.145869 type:complete len:447 (+) comp24288_c0_seq2:70-1410(+)